MIGLVPLKEETWRQMACEDTARSSGRKSILAETGNALASSASSWPYFGPTQLEDPEQSRERAFKGQMEGIWCTGFCLFVCLRVLLLTLPCQTGNLLLILENSAQSHLFWKGFLDLCRQIRPLLPWETYCCIIVPTA